MKERKITNDHTCRDAEGSTLEAMPATADLNKLNIHLKYQTGMWEEDKEKNLRRLQFLRKEIARLQKRLEEIRL